MHFRKQIALAVVLGCAFALGTAGTALAGPGDGAVYTLTNSASRNAVVVFERAATGALSPAGTVPTGGLGSGAGLGSQGALVQAAQRLFAVNAGSNTISAFRVGPSGTPVLTDTIASGGVAPISVTAHGIFVYALNAGDATHAANIQGFVRLGGRLFELPGSNRPLSSVSPGPAEVEFTPDGRQLVVTEKNTNQILTYRVGFFGFATGPVVQPSAGQTPFGFAFDPRGRLFVSEAFGGAPDASALSSYAVAGNGTVTPIDPVVGTTETAACWVVVTPDGRYAYVTNTGSASVSGYAIAPDGGLTLLDADGKTATVGDGPIDAALARGGHLLYVLSSGSHEITGFRVENDGSLTEVGAVGGLPASAVGLVAT